MGISQTAGTPPPNSLLSGTSEPCLTSAVQRPGFVHRRPRSTELPGPSCACPNAAKGPLSGVGLASPAANRSWGRKHVLAARTWDGRDLQPQPLQPGEEGDPLPRPAPQARGSQGLLLRNKFFFSFRGHGAPTLRGQPRPAGQQSCWEAHGQELERRPLGKKAGLFQEHKEQSLGRDRLRMLMARCWESVGPVLGEGRGRQRRASRPEPALAGTWASGCCALLPFQGGPWTRCQPPGGPALPRAMLSHLCPSHGDPGEHLLQAAHCLNIRANVDQQVLLKCVNHLLFLSCF